MSFVQCPDEGKLKWCKCKCGDKTADCSILRKDE
jgi:hypothetical protein